MTSESTSGGRATMPFASALRDAVDARGMTLARLHQRLRERGNTVSMATLSYWRSGSRRPEGAQSLAAVTDIEQLLGLDAGALSSRLGATLRTGPLGPTVFPFDGDSLEERIRDTFEAMGAVYPDPTRELTIHSVTDVGPDGRMKQCTTRLVMQGTSGLISAVPFVEIFDESSTVSPTYRALGGGRITKTHTDPSGTVHGFLFELERPIATPESTLIEWAVEYPPGFPHDDETGHGVALQCREMLLWTRFHPDAIPTWIEEVEETPSGVVTVPRTLDGSTSLHALRRSFGPGALSLRWGWEAAP